MHALTSNPDLKQQILDVVYSAEQGRPPRPTATPSFVGEPSPSRGIPLSDVPRATEYQAFGIPPAIGHVGNGMAVPLHVPSLEFVEASAAQVLHPEGDGLAANQLPYRPAAHAGPAEGFGNYERDAFTDRVLQKYEVQQATYAVPRLLSTPVIG